MFSPDWFALCTGMHFVLLQGVRLVILVPRPSQHFFQKHDADAKTFIKSAILFLPYFLYSTLETTFDTTVTTEVNGRSIPALAARSSPMSWRLGQSQTPRLQAGDAPSMPSSYAAPRASTTATSTTTGRYSGHSDPSRFVYTSAELDGAGACRQRAGRTEGVQCCSHTRETVSGDRSMTEIIPLMCS